MRITVYMSQSASMPVYLPEACMIACLTACVINYMSVFLSFCLYTDPIVTQCPPRSLPPDPVVLYSKTPEALNFMAFAISSQVDPI